MTQIRLTRRVNLDVEQFFSAVAVGDPKNEGNSGTTAFDYTVTSSRTFPYDVSFDYRTRQISGQATEGVDYVAAATVATLPAGQTQVTVTVNVNGDTDVESDETFGLTLSNFRRSS